MGSSKNAKKDKRQRSKEAAKHIQDKQSQKKKSREKFEKIIQKEKEERVKDKIAREEKRIKTKQEERAEFISSLPDTGRIISRDKRIEAQLADERAREDYQKHLNYHPKLEMDIYQSR